MLLLIVFRALALSIAIILADYFLPLGTNPFLLAISCSLGTISGAKLAQSKLKALGFFLFVLLIPALYRFLSFICDSFFIDLFSDPFLLHSLDLHASLTLIAFLIGCASTWLVVRSVHGLSIEVALIVFSTVYFFSGHRNFNFTSPQVLESLSWYLGYSPLAVLTALGKRARRFIK